jgi:hypothetical protein
MEVVGAFVLGMAFGMSVTLFILTVGGGARKP